MRSSIRGASKPQSPAKIAALTKAKKIKGGIRHIVVNTMGNPLSAVVHAAAIRDANTGFLAAESSFGDCPEIRWSRADTAYRGAFEQEVGEKLNLPVDISGRISGEKRMV